MDRFFEIEKSFTVKVEHIGDSAVDLPTTENFSLEPGQIKLVNTALRCLGMNQDMYGLVLPRSGLALKGITVVNSPGLVDSSYKGIIKVVLINIGKEEVSFRKHARIAQFMVQKQSIKHELLFGCKFHKRNENDGFGSSGV